MAEETTKKAKPKRLSKDLTGGVLNITVVDGAKGQMTFDPKELPQAILDQLPVFALSHKLGDSAAGRQGVEAEEAILNVWEGMKAGNWTVRAPAQPKVPVNDVVANFDKLSDKEKKAAAPLLKALGINIPGITA